MKENKKAANMMVANSVASETSQGKAVQMMENQQIAKST
jgi:hypothetical protein